MRTVWRLKYLTPLGLAGLLLLVATFAATPPARAQEDPFISKTMDGTRLESYFMGRIEAKNWLMFSALVGVYRLQSTADRFTITLKMHANSEARTKDGGTQSLQFGHMIFRRDGPCPFSFIGEDGKEKFRYVSGPPDKELTLTCTVQRRVPGRFGAPIVVRGEFGMFSSAKCGVGDTAVPCSGLPFWIVVLPPETILALDDVDLQSPTFDPTLPKLEYAPGYPTVSGSFPGTLSFFPHGTNPMAELKSLDLVGAGLTRDASSTSPAPPRPGSWWYGRKYTPDQVNVPGGPIEIPEFVSGFPPEVSRRGQLTLPDLMSTGYHTIRVSGGPFESNTYSFYNQPFPTVYFFGSGAANYTLERKILLFGPRLALSKPSIAPGEQLHVTGSGFLPDSTITLSAQSATTGSTVILGSFPTSPTGAFAADIRFPGATDPFFQGAPFPVIGRTILARIDDAAFQAKYGPLPGVGAGVSQPVNYVATPETGPGSIVTGPPTTGRGRAEGVELPAGVALLLGGLGSNTEGVAGARPAATQTVLASAERYNSSSRSWQPTGSLLTARAGHTATLLRNGTVLAAGGSGADGRALATAERYALDAGSWSATGGLAVARTEHTATLLADGSVLVAGGRGLDGLPLASAERYDPVQGTWSATGGLAVARSEHTATLLADGSVLVAGGVGLDGLPLASAERYDPVQGGWRAAGPLAGARSRHSATLLADGTVLVAGGRAVGGDPLASAERYTPASDSWSGAGSMTERREWHTATLLADGRVLHAGGYAGGSLATTELYAPAEAGGSWSRSGGLSAPRSGHVAVPLSDGSVLFAGGTDESAAATAELFGTAGAAGNARVFLPLVRMGTSATPGVGVAGVDDDAGNKFWGCEGNRTSFGSELGDKSRCFSFHYTVPPGGITSALLRVPIEVLDPGNNDVLAAATNHDSTVCEWWAQGNMPGCTLLDSTFASDVRTVEVDLFNVPGAPAADQEALIAQLQTGCLHAVLHDDTVVNSAMLELSGGAPLDGPCPTAGVASGGGSRAVLDGYASRVPFVAARRHEPAIPRPATRLVYSER